MEEISNISIVDNRLSVTPGVPTQSLVQTYIDQAQFELLRPDTHSVSVDLNDPAAKNKITNRATVGDKLYSIQILNTEEDKTKFVHGTGTKSYQCQFCYELFSDFNEYLSHEGKHLIEHPMREQTSEKAKRKVNDYISTNRKNSDHRHQYNSDDNIQLGQFQFTCLFCEQKFGSREKCKRHEQSHTGGVAYCNCDCEACQSMIEQTDKHQTRDERPDTPPHNQHLLQPLIQVKQCGDEMQIPNKVQLFQCKLCKAQFSRWIDMKTHERSHRGNVTSYSCKTCDKNFTSYLVFKIHTRSHGLSKSFQCSICNHSFLLYTTYRKHKTACKSVQNPAENDSIGDGFVETTVCKNGQRQLDSDSIGDGFSDYTFDFDDPMQTDDSAVKEVSELPTSNSTSSKSPTKRPRLYPCQYCEKTFSRATVCKIHERIHLNEQVLECNDCGSEFRSKVGKEVNTSSKSYCKECSKEKENEMKPESDFSQYKCIYCHMGFEEKSTLRKHEIDHTTEEHPFQCQHCAEAFSKKSLRKKHESISHKNGIKREYKCKFCTNVYNLQKDRKMHEKSCTHRYSCKYCEKQFATVASLKAHQQVHKEDQKFECKHCLKEFKNATQCRVHERVHTGIKPYKCPVCDKCFSRSDVCKNHIKTHGSDTPFPCPTCGKRFKFKMACKLHEKIHTNDRPYKCNVCAKGFVKKHDCTIHERTHTGEKPFTCEYCKRAFRRLDHKRSHERTHTGDRPYQCQYCVKAFITMQACKMHETSHTGDKRYICRHCDHRFSTSQQREFHERTHTGERPHQCMYCGKSFAQLSTCRKHELTHTGIKAFKCEYCDKTFISKHDRRIHERTHTGYKPYKCQYCDKAFSRVDTCKHHERTHTGETPYTCQFCPKKFGRSDHRKKHEKSHHSDQHPSSVANNADAVHLSRPIHVIKPERSQPQTADVVLPSTNPNALTLSNSVSNPMTLTNSVSNPVTLTNSVSNAMNASGPLQLDTSMANINAQNVAHINTSELLSNDMSQFLYSLALPSGITPHNITHSIQIEVSPGTQAIIAQGMQPGAQ